MGELLIEAPAKINLHLRVGEARSDGFHRISSIFSALEFGDTLRFSLLDKANVVNLKASRQIPDENIVLRAVNLFRDRTGFDRGLSVSIEKRIPLGGGLGGGSSDCAAALLALNVLGGGALSPAELMELGAKLGSDVPFFLSLADGKGSAWVEGRGEKLRPISVPKNLSVVLVNPGLHSSTPELYRLLDKARNAPGRRDTASTEDSFDALTGALAAHPRAWSFGNDFLPVLNRTEPVYGEILSRLGDLGANFSGLSGTGATCFGIFTAEADAQKAAEFLAKNYYFVQLTFFLARKPFTVLK
jgi:4-diphosphocytidyl-2-C-methyl-D-erythritol kinase